MQASTPLCRRAANIASKSYYTFNCREFHILASQRPLLDAVNPRSARRQSLQRPTPSKSNAQPGKRFRTSNGSQFTDIVFPDPNRPDLYYHFVNPPTPLSLTLPTFALSFLRESPPSVDSATVIGWLLAQTHKVNVSDSSTESEPLQSDASLQDFRGNPKFISFLHQVVQSGLTQGIDNIWKDTALQLQAGWMHIHDQRNPPDQGRIGDPDDIIGTVLVDNGRIRPETYQPMPSYRVCTSDGVLQLTPGLAEHLRHALERLIVQKTETSC